MLELWIADLISAEQKFCVSGSVGSWEFCRRDDYASVTSKLEDGQCAPTYYASNSAITHQITDVDFIAATDELIDACLVLSFLNARCVTPRGATAASDVQFIQLGDDFIRPRAIRGFSALQISPTYSQFFSVGMHSLRLSMAPRQLRLFLSHWISGLTCFSLEDLFLAIGVQMDIVKQCEINAIGKRLEYFPGMEEASRRYSLSPLSNDYKKMRNDIVHEGRLSGTNFPGKTKSDCASVVADTLNWIDGYVCAILGLDQAPTRWSGAQLAAGLPSLTVAR